MSPKCIRGISLENPWKSKGNPIAAGEKIGTIQLTLNGDTVATKPLIALESVEEGGLFKRLWHWLVLMIKGLFS